MKMGFYSMQDQKILQNLGRSIRLFIYCSTCMYYVQVIFNKKKAAFLIVNGDPHLVAHETSMMVLFHHAKYEGKKMPANVLKGLKLRLWRMIEEKI